MKLLVYDFVGRGPNRIPRKFFRELNTLLREHPEELRRIQKSVVMGTGETLNTLEDLVNYYGGSCRTFRVIEELQLSYM